jgi:two-component system, OmpR family, response regulator
VLVVEDDPSVRALLEAVLQDLDTFEIVLAERGDEGLRLARMLQPDVLVLDVMLPGLDGPEVISELREPDGSLPFAILVLTGAVEAAEVLRAELGRDAVIEKPFDIATLTSRVESLVARTHPSDAAATADEPATLR